MGIEFMVYAAPLVFLALAVIVVGGTLSAWFNLRLRVNLLCASGVLLSVIGVGFGWEYSHGDTGFDTGWPFVVLAGAYISLVTPLGGFVQVVGLLSDFGVGFSEGAHILGAEWLALAVLGSVIIVASIIVPLGPGLNVRTAGIRGRLLTVSPVTNPGR